MNSSLFLETDFINGKTEIKDVYFTAPYKIMSPFMEGSHMEVMLMSSSAGLLGGDSLTAEMNFGEQSDVTFVSQSYDKVFNTRDMRAEKNIHIYIGKDAKVKYMPYPVIPFANSNYISENIVHIHPGAKFFYSDIFTCGRTGMGERFLMKRFESRTKIFVGEQLDFADHTLISTKILKYDTLGMWSDYTHNGMAYIHTGSEDENEILIEKIRNKSENTGLLNGVSKTGKGFSLRTLGNSGEKIFEFYQTIANML